MYRIAVTFCFLLGTLTPLNAQNQMKIRVVGGKVITSLNGVQMVQFEDEGIAKGKGAIALQIHDGGGIKVKWRNIKLLPLSKVRFE